MDYDALMKAVPCYSLLDFLLPGDVENLKPYLRETFTETWKALGDSTNNTGMDLINTIETISGVEYQPQYGDSHVIWTEHGLRIEKALYAMAIDRKLTPILGRPR